MNIVDKMRQSNVQGLSIGHFNKSDLNVQNYGVLTKGIAGLVDNGTLFHACSISKMITAICVMNLVAGGVLSLEKDINTYLHAWRLEYQDNPGIPITLSMLLSHTAGIIDAPDSFEPYKENEAPISNLALLKGETRFHALPVKVTIPPRSQFEYSDAGYCIIRQVIEDTTGKTLEYFVDKYIVSPLSLTNTFFWHKGNEQDYPLERCACGHDSSGQPVKEKWACYPNPEGAGLWCTTTDLMAIVKDFIKCCNGKGIILPEKQARQMVTPCLSFPFIGLGIFLDSEKSSFFSQEWGVGMQCKLYGSLEKDEGIVVMMNCEPGVDQDHSIIGKIIMNTLSWA